MIGSAPHYTLPLEFLVDLSRVILTHNSLKTSFITGTLNVNNSAASVVNYSSYIDHMTESSSNGDFLKVPIAANKKEFVYKIKVNPIHTILKYRDYHGFMDR